MIQMYTLLSGTLNAVFGKTHGSITLSFCNFNKEHHNYLGIIHTPNYSLQNLVKKALSCIICTDLLAAKLNICSTFYLVSIG